MTTENTTQTNPSAQLPAEIAAKLTASEVSAEAQAILASKKLNTEGKIRQASQNFAYLQGLGIEDSDIFGIQAAMTQPAVTQMTVEVGAKAEVIDEPADKFGKWASRRLNRPVGSLSALGALNVDGNQLSFLGSTIYTLFADAGDVVGAAYAFAVRVQKGEIKLKDIEAERKVRDYRVDREQKMVRVVTAAQHALAWSGLKTVLSPAMNQVVEGTAILFDNFELSGIQPNTMIQLQAGVTSSPQRLRTQILNSAEFVSKNLTGEVVLTAEDLMGEIQAALEILSMKIVHVRLGVDYDPKQPMAHIAEVLDALGYTDVSAWVRLGDAWREYCVRWSEVVTGGSSAVDNAALFYLGEAASTIAAHAPFVNFEGGEAQTGDTFRDQARPAITTPAGSAVEPQPQAGRKFSFSFFASINLSFGFSKS